MFKATDRGSFSRAGRSAQAAQPDTKIAMGIIGILIEKSPLSIEEAVEAIAATLPSIEGDDREYKIRSRKRDLNDAIAIAFKYLYDNGHAVVVWEAQKPKIRVEVLARIEGHLEACDVCRRAKKRN